MADDEDGPPSDARGNVDLVGHTVVSLSDAALVDVDNVIIRSRGDSLEWATESMAAIGEWRARLRSVYIQWALAINGLHVVSELYRSDEYINRRSEFTVSSIRVHDHDQPDLSVIARWSWAEAADHHLGSSRKMAVFGLVDLYSNLEELIFRLALIHYEQHPDALIRGPEFRHLRQMRRQSDAGPEEMARWLEAIHARLETWQRNRLYDGLDSVLRTYFQHARLEKPPRYDTGVEEWARILRIFGVVRNSLIHGAQTVNAELAELSKDSGMEFKVDAPLDVSTEHLQAFELFTSQLLTGINMALVERVRSSE